MQTTHTQTHTLVSQYYAVQLHQLREAGKHKVTTHRTYSTYSLEYHVQYTTMGSPMKEWDGLAHLWNVVRDGFPTAHNLRAWCRKHEELAREAGADLIIVRASLVRSSTREIVVTVE